MRTKPLSSLALFRILLLSLLVPYGLIVLAQVAVLAAKNGVLRSILTIPLIVLSHLLYGLGFWRGLFTTFKPPQQRTTHAQVVLETVPLKTTEGHAQSKS